MSQPPVRLREQEASASRHTLSVLVENKPGVLVRIAGLFSRRGQVPSGKTGLPSKDDILDYVRKANAKPGKREIARAFSVKGGDRVALKQLLAEMAAEGLLTGNRDKLDALIRVLEPFGIKELVQSGMVALGRGSKSITDRALRPLDRGVAGSAQ